MSIFDELKWQKSILKIIPYLANTELGSVNEHKHFFERFNHRGVSKMKDSIKFFAALNENHRD